MGSKRQYQRHLKLVYGNPELNTSSEGPSRAFTIDTYAGRGLRVTFKASRNNRGEPDRCTIEIYNLPETLRNSLKLDLEAQRLARAEAQKAFAETPDGIVEVSDERRARNLREISDAFRVNLFVGYGPDATDLTLLFRGDLLDVQPNVRRGGVETITRIKLGDTLLALRDGYMRQSFGAGANLAGVIEGAARAAALDVDAGSKVLISQILPNAVTTKVANGWVAAGRVGDTITELIDQFGLQWWVREGTIYFAAQGATLDDFALQFTEGVDILDYAETGVYDDIRARVLLNPDVVPGRGVRLRMRNTAAGRSASTFATAFEDFGYRIDQADYQGDTHGPAWWADFLGAGADSRILAPSGEFTHSDFTTDDVIAELERERA